MKDMEDDKEELVLPGENVRPKGKIGIRHLVVFMGTYDITNMGEINKRRKYHKNARSSPTNNHCHSSFHLLSSAHASGFLGFANVYAMRVNLSVAIVAMVQDANSTHPNVTTPLPGNLTTTHHHANHTTTTHQHGNSTTTTTTTSKITKPATTTSSPTTENHDSFFGTMFFSRKG